MLGHKNIGKCFINSNANINAANNESQTPLHYAVKYGNSLEHIVAFTIFQWQRMAVIILWIYLGQIEFAELLINYGANVHVADENRKTPLHLAVEECISNNFFFCFSTLKKSLIKTNSLFISSRTCENPRITE